MIRRNTHAPHAMRVGLGLVIAMAVGTAGVAQTTTSKPPMRTLMDAMAMAYSSNPTLLAERANLRATDENVPAALAGWRPTVTVSANAGRANGELTLHSPFTNANAHTNENRSVNSEQVTLTQPIYRGGQTRASTNQAVNRVMSERGRLIAQEQSTLSTVVTDYVTVIQDEQILALNTNNEQVLTKQLQATNDRFRVGEITQTDVAQAQAALAGATAARQTAEGNLATARAAYQQIVGEYPDKLTSPQPLRLPTATLQQARELAATNNPNVVAALFANAAAKDNFDLQYAKLMPTLSIQALASNQTNVNVTNQETKTGQILAVLAVPIYQGGSEYAAIRQARQAQEQTRQQVLDARNTAVQQAISSWQTYQAAKATIDSTRSQVRSNEVALEGTERQAIVGSLTTLDVLNAEQLLLNSRVTLVQNLASLVTASYNVAAAVGRLTARDLNLPVPLYDETAYYNAVKNKWIGTGDAAIDQPGR